MIVIEKNIPFRSGHIYPWSSLEIGDSFFAPDVKPNSMHAQVSQVAKRLGIKLATRRENGGIRVWRVA